MTDTMTRGTVNGVDVDALFATIGAIKESPAIADFRFRVDNRWLDGGRNRSEVKGFDGAGEQRHPRAVELVFDNDEPPVLLGTDQSANPVEFVLHALAGCLTTSLVYHAAARGVTVRRVESRLEGDLDLRGFLGMDDCVRNGYQQIRVTMRVDADASDEDIAELVTLAHQRSPVFDIVTNPVPVTVSPERL